MTLEDYNKGVKIREQIFILMKRRADLIQITSQKSKCDEIVFRCRNQNDTFSFDFGSDELTSYADNMLAFVESQIQLGEKKFAAIGLPETPVEADEAAEPDEDRYTLESILNTYRNETPPADGEKTSLKVSIGNLTIDLKSEWHDGKRSDTEINIDMLNLCVVSGEEVLNFLCDLNNTVKKYGI